MNVFKNLSVFCITILVLTACGEPKVMTSKYYIDNPDEIKKVLAECKEEGEKGYKVEGNLAENCENARYANSVIWKQKIRDASK